MDEKTMRILLIEDDPDDVVLIADTLSMGSGNDKRFFMSHAPDLCSARELLEREDIDIVLLDLNLPDCSGLDCLKCVMDERPELPIIILTGFTDENSAVEALRRGAQDYIRKTEISGNMLDRSMRYAIERKSVERALREGEEKFRRIFQSSKDAILITSGNGRIVEINEAGIELAGYDSRDDLIGRDVAEFFKSPQERIKFMRSLKTRGLVRDLEVQIRKRDETIIPCLISSITIKNEKGESTGYQSYIHDLTLQKSLEMQIIQGKKMDAIQNLACGIARDINDILNVLMKNIETMRQLTPEGHPIFQKLVSLEDVGRMGQDLAARLLQLGSPGETEVGVISLNGVLEKSIPVIQTALPRNIVMESSLCPENPFIKADPALIILLITNLSLNSRDAMPEGGRLIFETGTGYLDEEYCRCHLEASPGNNCYLRIRDTGSGILPEHLELLFEPFFTTKKEGKGNGLGLPLVYSAVRNMGGWIGVMSKPGMGAEFTVYFPRTEKPPEKLEKTKRGNGTILLADDEEILLLFGQSVLEDKGFRVLRAYDWAEVIEKLNESRDDISLAILDWSMPGCESGDGIARVYNVAPDLPVIICSSFARDYFSWLPENRRIAYLPKSFAPMEMVNLVREMLGREA